MLKKLIISDKSAATIQNKKASTSQSRKSKKNIVEMIHKSAQQRFEDSSNGSNLNNRSDWKKFNT